MRIRRVAPWTVMAAIVALVLGSASLAVQADDAPAANTGTISGKVVDKDGNGVSGAKVEIFAVVAHKKKADTAARPHRERPKVVASATSGQDGTFKIENVPAGKYRLVAGLKGTGRGWDRKPVEVTAGQDTAVGSITLEAPRGRHRK